MSTVEESGILKKLSSFGINKFESLKKLKRQRLIEKLGFSEAEAEYVSLIQNNSENIKDYDYKLMQYSMKYPQKLSKFFKENNINYETIFQTKLTNLINQIDKMSPSKISAFKDYKNQCMRIRYNNTKKDNKEFRFEEIGLLYVEQFRGYLNRCEEELIISIVKERIDTIKFESVDFELFASEILSFIDIDYELKEHSLEINRLLIINIIKGERKAVSLFTIKNKIDYFILENIDIQHYLLHLSNEGFVKYTSEGIRYNIPTVREYIQNNKRLFEITNRRLLGYTLEMIGEEESVTRERIRQKGKRELNKLPIEEIYEYRFLKYYKKYELTEEEFCRIFSLDNYQYRFIDLYNKKEDVLMSKEDLMESDELTFKEREHLESILNRGFLVFENRKIRNKKIDIIEYLIEIYAQEEISKDYFFNVVREFSVENNLDIDFSSDRAIDGLVSRAENVLLKYGRKMVHYQVGEEEVLEKLKSIDFTYFMNQEISAKKILETYKVCLNQIEIYDEYELHNLMKKYNRELPKFIELTRMPFIEIGEVNREEQVLNLLIELSPISIDDFVLAYSERYGVQMATVRANFLNVIEEFETDGIYISDTPVIDVEIVSNLKTILVNDFYFKEDVQNLYDNIYGCYQIPDFLFKKIGYKSYSEFVLRDIYNRANLFFEEKYFDKEMFDIKDNRLYLLGSFRNTLEQKKSNFSVFEYQKNSYISMEKLTKFANIQYSDIIELLSQIDSYISNQYFTFSNIEFLVERSKLNELGFDSMFYESILKSASLYRYQMLGGTVLFRKTKEKFYSYDLLEVIIARYKVIDIYDLMDLLDDKYTIKLSKEKIISDCVKRDLYFNPTMEMIYLDIDKFYEMMEE
ncbi:hypothetical protein [Brochothrix thermosphacta]|uniref:hypothetical protein n=1 Tax=Brochothrix thermosphacta TaxID=2756 RepID=UPI0039B08148